MATETNPRVLLVSDLDDTLLGDDEALARFRAFHAEHRDRVGLVYASGRFCASIQERIDATGLPEPAATIGGVGCEIWRYPERTPLRDWWERIGAGWSADAVREALDNVSRLELQPPEHQSLYKVSWYLRDAEPADLDGIEARLEAAGVAARLIYSSRRDLDVLPAGVDKGSAAAWLAGRLGFAPDAVLGAGNSLNDAALMGHGFAGIVVGNAHDDLKALAGRDRVYLATAAYADGVREGIEHWLEELGS